MTKKGFTIIELAVVLMVIGIIMAITVKGADIFKRANTIHILDTINSMLVNADVAEKFHYDNFGVSQSDYSDVVAFFSPENTINSIDPKTNYIRYITCSRRGALTTARPSRPFVLDPVPLNAAQHPTKFSRASGCLELMSTQGTGGNYVPMYPNAYAVCQFEAIVDDQDVYAGRATADISNSIYPGMASSSRNFKVCPSSLRDISIDSYYYITTN